MNARCHAVDVGRRNVRTFVDVVSTSAQAARLLTRFSVHFGSLAPVVAAVGAYSVLAYAVAQRHREFAIRAAVGAPRTRVRSAAA